MAALIEEILSTLALIAQAIPGGSSVDSIITLLSKLIALGTTEVEAVVPEIQNIIAALQSNATVTSDQMASLAALDASVDAAFNTAAANDGLTPTSTTD